MPTPKEAVRALTSSLAKINALHRSQTQLPPAGLNETQMAELEAQLGFALPSDYREFLSACNGWPDLGDNITFFDRDLLVEPPEDLMEMLEDMEVEGNARFVCAHTQEDRGTILVCREDGSVVFLEIEQEELGEPTTFTSVLNTRVTELLLR